MRNLFYKYALLCACVLFGAVYAHASPLLERTHERTVSNYLQLIDAYKLPEAWQSMTPLFRTLNDEQRWTQHVSAIRQTYGNVTAREILRSSLRSSYHNAPDGEYLIIQVGTTFEHKAKGVETVVLQCSEAPECTVTDYIIN